MPPPCRTRLLARGAPLSAAHFSSHTSRRPRVLSQVRFSFYEPPILVQLRPASGPVAGSQLVSVVAIGLENHGGTMDARCMFGDTVVPAHTKTRSAIVCSTPRLRGAQAATTAIGVRLSINAADFTDEELVYEYHDPLYNQTGE